jgi:two-component system sensor histidine kinase MprB
LVDADDSAVPVFRVSTRGPIYGPACRTTTRVHPNRVVSLRVRLLLVVSVTFALVVVGCVFAAHVIASRQLRSVADQFLTQRAARFTEAPSGAFPSAPSDGFDGSSGPDPGDRVALADPDALTQILSEAGVVTSSIQGQPALPVDARDRTLARAGGKPHFRDATIRGVPYRMLTVALPNGGAAQIARSIRSDRNLLATLDVRLLLIALAGTLLVAGLAWFIARRTVRPIEQLTKATAYVAQTQDLANQIPIARRDEIGRLAASFNTMLVTLHNMVEALHTSREQQKRLVMDASHELRTPLTALRTNIDFLVRSPAISDADRIDVLAETEEELKELSDLVAELVELATDARADEPVARVDLRELTEQVVARYQRRSGRSITLDLSDPYEIEGRANMIDRAVSNLIDNALKFSPAGTAVDVVVNRSHIQVCDRGPGISADQRERVFDRFYRTDDARNRPGSGLGLAIVKEIATVHDGSVTLDSRDGGGTIATLELPTPSPPFHSPRERASPS